MEAATAVKTAIRDFVLTAVNLTDLDDAEDLFEAGFVNSLFAIQLIAYLEKTFEIQVEAEDLDMENLKSIDAAASFVISKRNGQGT